MSKTAKNLYGRICEMENIHLAYMKARRNKRYRPEVLEFSARLETNLARIQRDLINEEYRPSAYRTFQVYEPKLRTIMALPFPDRVVHHAICNVIEPIFESRFIYDSYACRRSKGIHAGADRVTQFLRAAGRSPGALYCLKGDVSRYFPSIVHDTLLAIIKKRIACRPTFGILETIVRSHNGAEGRGIPIGNLTSQLFANAYLDQFDHYVKEELRIRRYVRYMDDFVVLDKSKTYLREIRAAVESFLSDRLGLDLNPRTDIFPAARGIDFLGYRIWPDYRLVRKASVIRMRRRLKKMVARGVAAETVRASLASWLGYCSHADTHRLTAKLQRDIGL